MGFRFLFDTVFPNYLNIFETRYAYEFLNMEDYIMLIGLSSPTVISSNNFNIICMDTWDNRNQILSTNHGL